MSKHVPEAVLELLQTLRRAGHEAWLVGGCVRSLLGAGEVTDWDITTSADVHALQACLPRAIPLGGVHHTHLAPTSCGPVDITPYRPYRPYRPAREGTGSGTGKARTHADAPANTTAPADTVETARPSARLLEDLGRRDFTINAMAFDPFDDFLLDPMDGLADLSCGVLRTPGDPTERLAEDPLRALRAARLAAELQMTPDPALEKALPAFAGRLAQCAAERLRAEVERLLAQPSAAVGVALLRRSGLEAALFPGARADCEALVERLPAKVDLRLCAWLRGTRSQALLARLRIPAARAREIERVLALHPVEALFSGSLVSARRIRRRARSPEVLENALRLRRAESDAPEVHAALDELCVALEQVENDPLERSSLALNGHEVAAALGAGPGPQVGRALRFLAERVLQDPTLNRPPALRELLRAWRQNEDR